ncbi:MAG: hypothetical protein EHM39_07300 [Chloroflexi bacterium]|nr:MAG: hypothetical protein EHM39_07300 [Chloroflexota bacterium]
MEPSIFVSEPMLAVWSILGALLGTLLIAAMTLWAGAQVTRQARGLWTAVRGQRAAVVGAVDDPTDLLVRQFASITPIPAAVWAAFLPAFLNALAEGLDRALKE